MKRLLLAILVVVVPLVGLAQSQAEDPDVQRPDTLTLQEVVVKASQPASRLTSDGIVTAVEGTPLQGVGTLDDILGFMPGITRSDGHIEVVGKGMPVIYINGRRVYDYAELQQISSDKVKDVTVITNPGAKYANTANAVIRIRTLRNYGDGFALENRAVAGVCNYLYAKDILGLNYRDNGFDLFATLEYDYSKSRGSSKITQSDYNSSVVRSEYNQLSNNERRQSYSAKIGFNKVFGADHSFGLYYQFGGTPVRKFTDFDTQYDYGSLSIASENSQKVKNDAASHLIDGYYSGKWGGFSSDISFDILWRNQAIDLFSKGIGGAASDASFHTRDMPHGRMIAGKIDMGHPVGYGSIDFGAEYINSRRTDIFSSDHPLIADGDNKLVENNIGVYIGTSQQFGNLSLNAGLRYEHIDSEYFNYDGQAYSQRHLYNEFLPSVTLMMPWSMSIWQLQYARRYKRPLYSQLNSTVVYSTPYTFESGNPLLKSSYTDVVDLNFMWSWLTAMLSYRHVKDDIVDVVTSYAGSPDITLLTKGNSPDPRHELQALVQVQPGLIGGVWYPLAAAGVISQFYDISFCGQPMHMNNPMGIVKWMNIFMLPQDWRIGLDLSWRSEGDTANVHVGQVWQTDFNISKSFGQHWDLKLVANDLLNTSATQKFNIYSGNRLISMSRHQSMRNIELNITYRFNMPKTKYKGHGAGANEKSRL